MENRRGFVEVIELADFVKVTELFDMLPALLPDLPKNHEERVSRLKSVLQGVIETYKDGLDKGVLQRYRHELREPSGNDFGAGEDTLVSTIKCVLVEVAHSKKIQL